MTRYKLVPVEATEGMAATFRADAGSGTEFTHTYVQCADFGSRYVPMLAAAPEPDWTDYALALLDCLADEGADGAFHNAAHPQHALFMAAFDAIHAHEAKEEAGEL
jgi:hypothetical protein